MKHSRRGLLLLLTVVAIVISTPLSTRAGDPDPLQDFCIGDLTSNLHVNGYPCKDPSKVTHEDFVYHGLEKPRADLSSNYLGAIVTTAFAPQFPGINTQGVSLARLDFAANGGLDDPHWHPRATEILFVVEGTLLVAFVDSKNKLWANVLEKGGVTVFPRGMSHFQLNVGNTTAMAVSGLGSQNPGRVDVGPAAFGSHIQASILQRTFNLTAEAVDKLTLFFSTDRSAG